MGSGQSTPTKDNSIQIKTNYTDQEVDNNIHRLAKTLGASTSVDSDVETVALSEVSPSRSLDEKLIKLSDLLDMKDTHDNQMGGGNRYEKYSIDNVLQNYQEGGAETSSVWTPEASEQAGKREISSDAEFSEFRRMKEYLLQNELREGQEGGARKKQTKAKSESVSVSSVDSDSVDFQLPRMATSSSSLPSHLTSSKSSDVKISSHEGKFSPTSSYAFSDSDVNSYSKTSTYYTQSSDLNVVPFYSTESSAETSTKYPVTKDRFE